MNGVFRGLYTFFVVIPLVNAVIHCSISLSDRARGNVIHMVKHCSYDVRLCRVRFLQEYTHSVIFRSQVLNNVGLS